MAAAQVALIALPGIPMVEPGDDLAAILIEGIEATEHRPRDRDVLVVAQKIVSKAEGRYRRLEEVTASPRAEEIGRQSHKDPRLIEVILSESREVIRCKRDVVITEHRLGFVMANAGVDQSNVEHAGGERVLLLPEDPDGSCRALKQRLDAHFGASLGVVINDSFGRPWRRGTIGVALGAAGIPALWNLRGQPDLNGRTLKVTETGFADEVAAAASLLMGQADEGHPVVLVSGFAPSDVAIAARTLIRPAAEDLFR